MIALQVKKGTKVRVIEDGKEWYDRNFTEEELEEDKLFFAEDIRIDPLGHVGCGPQNTNVIGGVYAKAGWYGFQDGNRVMLVPFNNVEAS